MELKYLGCALGRAGTPDKNNGALPRVRKFPCSLNFAKIVVEETVEETVVFLLLGLL